MTINKSKKYKITFSAIEKSNKLNEKKANAYTIINKDEAHYMVLDSKSFDSYEFYVSILANFKKLDRAIDVDLDSFIEIVGDKEVETLIATLLAALEYVSVTP